jgi:hypothetical protein
LADAHEHRSLRRLERHKRKRRIDRDRIRRTRRLRDSRKRTWRVLLARLAIVLANIDGYSLAGAQHDRRAPVVTSAQHEPRRQRPAQAHRGQRADEHYRSDEAASHGGTLKDAPSARKRHRVAS